MKSQPSDYTGIEGKLHWFYICSQGENHDPREELKEERRKKESGLDYQESQEDREAEDDEIEHLQEELENTKRELEDTQTQLKKTRRMITKLEVKVKVFPRKPSSHLQMVLEAQKTKKN